MPLADVSLPSWPLFPVVIDAGAWMIGTRKMGLPESHQAQKVHIAILEG